MRDCFWTEVYGADGRVREEAPLQYTIPFLGHALCDGFKNVPQRSSTLYTYGPAQCNAGGKATGKSRC
jgi:hypothetical protein